MTPLKISCVGLLCFALFAGGQDKKEESKKEESKKEESKKKLDEFEKNLENRKEKPKTSTVILQVVVHKDCKIIVNEKEVPYEKFEVLMEFAGSSFIITELTYRSEVMTMLKLRSKE